MLGMTSGHCSFSEYIQKLKPFARIKNISDNVKEYFDAVNFTLFLIHYSLKSFWVGSKVYIFFIFKTLVTSAGYK